MLFTMRTTMLDGACHVAPRSAETYTPSRSPNHTSPSPSTDSAETCLTLGASPTASQVFPPAVEILTAFRPASTAAAFDAATKRHSWAGSDCTSLHAVPF